MYAAIPFLQVPNFWIVRVKKLNVGLKQIIYLISFPITIIFPSICPLIFIPYLFFTWPFGLSSLIFLHFASGSFFLLFPSLCLYVFLSFFSLRYFATTLFLLPSYLIFSLYIFLSPFFLAHLAFRCFLSSFSFKFILSSFFFFLFSFTLPPYLSFFLLFLPSFLK